MPKKTEKIPEKAKTEKFVIPMKYYQVTCINGASEKIAAVNDGVLSMQVVEFMNEQHLSYPIGLRPGGIQQITKEDYDAE